MPLTANDSATVRTSSGSPPTISPNAFAMLSATALIAGCSCRCFDQRACDDGGDYRCPYTRPTTTNGAAMIDRSHITGLVLAGGRGSRMGGVDKGLQTHHGMPLAMHALLRLAPQVGETMINANRNLGAYESMGAPVWPDALADYPGPLAGFLAGLEHCTTPYLATVPCDSPLFPEDLVARLAARLAADDAEVAIAATREDGELRLQPVFCLMQATVLESLVALHRQRPAQDRRLDGDAAPGRGRVRRRAGVRQRQHARRAARPAAMSERASLQEIASCVAGYDPKALPVAQAQEFIARLVPRVQAIEKVALRSALGRVLAADVVSAIDVPSNDNSAMDGYALRGSELDGRGGERIHRRRRGLRRRPVRRRRRRARMRSHHDRRGDAGRARHRRAAGVRARRRQRRPRPGRRRQARRQPAPGRRGPGARRSRRWPPAAILRPADLGMLASLGSAEVAVFRRLRVAFFSTGNELRSVGETLDAGCGLRQQPLHDLGDAAAPRRRGARPRRRPRRSGRSSRRRFAAPPTSPMR